MSGLRDWASSTQDMLPHIDTLTALASGRPTIIEFGTRTGVSTWALLDGLPDGGRLTSVDTDPTVPEYVPARVAEDPRWTLITGGDLDPDVIARLPRRPELVFIDTTHEEAQTFAELMVADGLRAHTIALHDWMTPGVEAAVHAFCLGHPYRLAGIDPSPWGLAWLVRR